MTPIDIAALRKVLAADGHDEATVELVENIYAIAPAKTCEGMLGMAFNYGAEAINILAGLMKKTVPLRAYETAPPVVTIDEWPILFVPGSLHLHDNLPLENVMVIVLGDLTVDGVIGSYRDFELTMVIVKGDLTTRGIEGDKEIVVDGSVTADIVYFEGNEGLFRAHNVHARIFFAGDASRLAIDGLQADFSYSTHKPVDLEAMQRVLAPEAFVPEKDYVFEGYAGYGCVNRALRLMQLGHVGFLTH